jgi:small-conductance mechanosensitive channel
MKNSLPIKLARGSFFLLLAFIAAFFPRLVHVPEPPLPELSLSTIATILALFMQGVVWANIIISHYVQRSVQRYVSDGSSITTFKALGALARVFIWIALGLAGLSALHIQVRPLLTGLGIGGLAIALAVQNILGDLFAAISIVVDKPFVVGDSISVENYRGKVEHIGLKTTRLRSESGEQIIFSNGELLKSKIRNYSR